MDLIFASVLKKTCGLLKSKSIAAKPVCTSRPPSQSLRFASGRSNCGSDFSEPSCSPEKLKQSPCMVKMRDEKKKKEPLFKSMWEDPDCCNDPCPDLLPRFDELYYRISDKAKRKYTRTWKECPKQYIKPKLVCDYDKLKLPPLVKRKKCNRPKTACEPADCKTDKRNLKCPLVGSPGCKAGRVPPRCYINRRPTDCKKVCAPYPAFSECKKPPAKKVRPIECDCLRPRSQCSMFEYLRMQNLAKANKV